MSGDQYAVILVHSTSHAIRGEKLLQKAGVLHKLIPVPRQLSSDCGICIRVERKDAEAALCALECGGLEVDGLQDI